MGADSIQEVSVMAYNNDSIVEVFKIVFKPMDGLKVKVVGRLVQKKNIWISKKCLGKKYPDLQVIFDFIHLLFMKSYRDSKAIQHLCSCRFSLPATKFTELTFKLRSPQSIFFREIIFGIDGISFLHDVIEMFETHDYSVDYSIIIIFEVILLQCSKSFTGSDYNLS